MERDENIVTKGEIAHLEQFLLWLQCYQKSSPAEASENFSCETGFKECYFTSIRCKIEVFDLTISHLQIHFDSFKTDVFDNTVTKGIIAQDKHLPQCFQLIFYH